MTMLMRFVLPVALPIALGACASPANVGPDRAAQNEQAPGWTGRTFVVGSNSTVAGDAEATFLQQKWGIGRER